MLQDLRYAIRSLGRTRGFTFAAVATLAIGIAANAVVFGIVDGLILRPLPFGDRAPRLVTLHSTHPTQAQDWDDSGVSYPDLIDIRERAESLERVEGFFTRNLSLASTREAERVQAASITPGLFSLLGVAPQLGRDFIEADGAEPGFERVVIISHRLWERLYDSDPAVAGRTILVNARALTVIGVMPERFAFPENEDVWLPYQTSRQDHRDRRNLLAVGLLRPGRSLLDARAELASIAAHMAETYPATNRLWGIHAIELRDLFVNDATHRSLGAMLLAVALVLLVACANVASLLVARGLARHRELSVRAALGASRTQVARLLLVESAVLAVAGAGIGLILAGWGLDALVASMPEPPVYWMRMEISGRVLVFTALVTALSAIACGLFPALRSARSQIAPDALGGGRSSTGLPGQQRLQGSLLAGQVAISFALLVAATLLARSAMMLQHADIGFDPSALLSLRVYVAGDAYDDPVMRTRTFVRMTESLRALPGVEAAAATGAIPGDDGGQGVRLVPPGAASAGEEIGAQQVPITSSFFDALGIPLLQGRTFDSADAERVDGNAVIVSARLAGQFWPGESALGRELRARTNDGVSAFRVIGVAPDLVYEELGEESAQSRLIVYVPHVRAGWRTMALLVRTRTAPQSVASAARGAIRDIDPAFAPYDVMTMRERRRATSWGERFLARAFSAFALAALLLACVGAYGLTAQAAAMRAREIGVRMAIGAQRQDIIRLLLGRGSRLALLGALTGLPLAIGAARLVQGLLFNTSPWTPGIWLVLPAALLAAVLLASFLPARRASLVDPAVALRQE